MAVLTAAGPAQALKPVVVKPTIAEYELGWHHEYLEDQAGTLGIEDVRTPAMDRRFKASRTDIPNFGFTTAAYWIRFDLHSQLAQSEQLILEVGNAFLDRVEVFAQRTDGSAHRMLSGDSFPYGRKVIRYFTFLFPLELAPKKRHRIYIRVQTQGSLQLPLKLWTRQRLQEHAHAVQVAYGIYLGLIIIILFYNLFLFFSLKDRAYLVYVLYIISNLVYQSSFEGLAQELLWPAWPWWANRVLPLSVYLTTVGALLFAKEFLVLRDYYPRWNRILSAIVGLILFGALGSLVFPYNIMTLGATVMALWLPVVPMTLGFLVWRRGFRPARYYLAAWVVWLLGIVLIAASRLGVLPRNMLTDMAHLYGFLINLVLFSLALADRINVIVQEKERTQSKLREAYEQLAEHDRLKSKFFTNVSHELRTPLTMILTPLEGLLAGRMGSIPDQAAVKLRSMVGNTQRLLRLVNQLLDFSRLESGTMEVTYELCDVQAVTVPIVQAFEIFAQSKGIGLELRSPQQLPKVYTDPIKLDKVLCNLLSNACKFTETGGNVVVRLDEVGRSVTIAVKDTGPGIRQEELPKIFERFQQLDGGTSRRYEGTGIGLSLSSELVQLIGGELQVQSELGVGSTFTVSLPTGGRHISDPALIRHSDEQEEEPPSRMSDAATVAVAMQAELGTFRKDAAKDRPGAAESEAEEVDDRPQLLVVEDNPDMRALVAEICGEDYRVLEAADGQEGLEVFSQHRPSLLILDVMMPRMDGYTMLQRIRSDPLNASLPVMMLTAKASPELRLEGLESGADDYLSKPFDPRELRARVRNLMRLKQQERRLQSLNAELQSEVVAQAAELVRVQSLASFLSPEVVKAVVEQRADQEVVVPQQRKSLTVFRVKLHGFDVMMEQLEPESQAAVLNSYLSVMAEIAFAHGATVDGFVQDTVMGFFGAPTSSGSADDARRCARAVLEMWGRAETMCRQWQDILSEESLVPTAVLASGFATVGTFGSSNRLDYTAVGGPQDDASALLSAAPAGAVTCAQSTWTLIKGEVEGEPSGEATLQHRSRKVKLYRLTATSEGGDA